MLFGFSFKQPQDVSKVLGKFFEFSHKNPHGWGMAIYDDMHTPVLIKEPVAAYRSGILESVIRRSVVANLGIAHIRYASKGAKRYNNTHPFQFVINQEEWVLAHNGTLNLENYRVNEYYPSGDTDSEKLFCLIADQIAETDKENRIECIDEKISRLAGEGKCNVLMSNGSNLYVHSNLKNSLYKYEDSGRVCFATKVDNENLNKWQPVEINKLFVYKDGELVYEGKAHKNEFVI
jgi:glutamine amidotransferase